MRYDHTHHQRAFELYLEHRSYGKVCAIMGISTLFTVQNWGSKDYRCQYGCPWHDYQRLLEERAQVSSKAIDLIERGVSSEQELLDRATAEIRKKFRTAQDKKLMMEQIQLLVRSDLERLSHWEYLYGKVYFDLTGIALPYEQLVDSDKYTLDPRKQYAKGLSVTDFTKGVYLLKEIQNKIDEIKNRNTPPEQPKAETDSDDEQMSIAELRQLRQQLDNPVGFNIGLGQEDRVIDVDSEE
jgi:hypothetical protein